MHLPPSFVFLYGPMGSGKTTVGRLLAAAYDLPFWDLDAEIETASGLTIAEIFHRQGEPAFRDLESRLLEEILRKEKGIVALGGGALLDPRSRARVEDAGPVLCLIAPLEALLERVTAAARPGKRAHPAQARAPNVASLPQRPLLGADQADPQKVLQKLAALLEQRGGHYASFPMQVDTALLRPEGVARQAQIRLGWFRVRAPSQGFGAPSPGSGSAGLADGTKGFRYNVLIREGALSQAGEALQQAGLGGPVGLVSDENVASLYSGRVMESLRERGYAAGLVCLPPGEASKTPASLAYLWEKLVGNGLERGSTVTALGGGVVGDLAGFAAATTLRGVAWAALPTTLLAMCDASIGGKTGADLPQGKNLIGAFHSPRLVLADPLVLNSLPPAELRSGMAEVVKAGILGDPALFALCEAGWPAVSAHWAEVVARAAAVKIDVIQADPFEKGLRATLNLGHTLGHAVEWASHYGLSHGQAVAIGTAAAAHLAERLGLAEPGLAERIEAALQGLDLPTRIPAHLSQDTLLAGLRVDKKRAAGQTRFVLPLRIGEVRHGIPVEEEQICAVISSCMDPT